MTRKLFVLTFLVLAAIHLATPVIAEDAAPTLTIPEGAQAGPGFDVPLGGVRLR